MPKLSKRSVGHLLFSQIHQVWSHRSHQQMCRCRNFEQTQIIGYKKCRSKEAENVVAYLLCHVQKDLWLPYPWLCLCDVQFPTELGSEVEIAKFLHLRLQLVWKNFMSIWDYSKKVPIHYVLFSRVGRAPDFHPEGHGSRPDFNWDIRSQPAIDGHCVNKERFGDSFKTFARWLSQLKWRLSKCPADLLRFQRNTIVWLSRIFWPERRAKDFLAFSTQWKWPIIQDFLTW